MQKDGWHLIGVSTADLDAEGILYTLIKPHVNEVFDSDGNVITPMQLCDCLITHIVGKDYIDEGKEILNKLSAIYPGLRK